ncbi:MAG: MmcQ/YjbR family DNA-binding protein [bacterium]
MPDDPILERLRTIIFALPETVETDTWGSPHFRVNNKIFVGYGIGDDGPSMSFRADLMEQADLIQQARYSIAHYTGRYGGTTMLLNGKVSWKDVAQHVEGSYRIIAPKRLIKLLDNR